MARTVSLSLLENVRIASPCPVRWEDMREVGPGDEVRHCDQCDLNVYNLSRMDPDQAEKLLATHEGRLCAGFWRRADGTVLTKDCPVGLAAVRAALGRKISRGVALVGVAISALIFHSSRAMGFEHAELRELQPFRRVCDWLHPSPAIPLGAGWTGGIVCPPPPPAPPPGGSGPGAGAGVN